MNIQPSKETQLTHTHTYTHTFCRKTKAKKNHKKAKQIPLTFNVI